MLSVSVLAILVNLLSRSIHVHTDNIAFESKINDNELSILKGVIVHRSILFVKMSYLLQIILKILI
jgi:hypothetical protein